MNKQGCVYIVSNFSRTVLYTGVTSNLEQRMYQHRLKLIDGFSKTYNCTDLLWWEHCENIVSAIEREKQIKGYSRERKNQMIRRMNPKSIDLSWDLFSLQDP